MMVSLACVILLMLAYTQLFSDVGGRIGDARSMIELTNRMRSASHRLRSDLEAHTCDLLPWRDPAAGQGYFEIIEGPIHDMPSSIPADNPATLWDESHPVLGDVDDVLMFTVRSKDGPFTGKYWNDANGNGAVDAGELLTVQSEVAEVVWFLRPTLQRKDSTTTIADQPTNPPTYTLYRRAFLVMPTYQGRPTPVPTRPTASVPYLASTTGFYDNCDLSVHSDLVNNKLVANTLGDLTKRECRYGHSVNTAANDPALGFPHKVDPSWLVPFGGVLISGAYSVNTNDPRYGEDVVLTNVLAFDVQVWDPKAPVQTVGTAPNQTAVVPGDPGYSGTGTPVSQGAYVDLNWANAGWPAAPPVADAFATIGHPKSKLQTNASALINYNQTWLHYPLSDTANYKQPATYDTWSSHYEHDGINQANPGSPSTADPASDGFQDDASNFETSPPYPVPLRGIRVKIRCYEPDARQVHEVTVVESFVPE
jgi:hypothetical protein